MENNQENSLSTEELEFDLNKDDKEINNLSNHDNVDNFADKATDQLSESEKQEVTPNSTSINDQNYEQSHEPSDVDLPDIPGYVYKNEIITRHKILQNALLTPELIKFFDTICQNINLQEKNYFNITNFLVSSNFSIGQKETLQNKFNEMVELLSEKTVDLIKILEHSRYNKAIAISLKEQKNFDLVLFHKINDYVVKTYNEKNPLRKPILYNLEQVSENIKIPKNKLDFFCINKQLREINIQHLKTLSKNEEENKDNGKIILTIDLQNEQFVEAIFPLYILSNLLEYLCRQINDYLDNVNNEKVASLIIKKLKESKIDLTSIKPYLINPDPHNAKFSAFIRIFYSTISQTYSRNANYSNKKIKETEDFLVISLLARQLIINTKLNKTDEEDTTQISDNMIVQHLLNQVKEINFQTVRMPVTMDHLCKIPLKKNNLGKPIYVNHEQLINSFQKLNNDNHTIKEILIVRHNSLSYYIHRATIVPFYINLLDAEKIRIKSILDKEIAMNQRQFLKQKASFEQFIEERINTILKIVHECLIRCLMVAKPLNYQDNQSIYWISRFFFAKDELNDYQLNDTELDFKDNKKIETFKKFIKAITHSNKNFKSLIEILEIPYESYSSFNKLSVLGFLSTLSTIWTKLLNLLFLSKTSSNAKKSSANVTPTLGKDSYSNPKNTLHKTSNGKLEKSKPTNPTKHVKSKELIKQLENKLPLLKDDHKKIKQKINEEIDNWNLKIGESRQRNLEIINGIINACIVRIENRELATNDFDNIYAVIVRNNPVIKKIKNQESLKKYIMYKIMFNKYNHLKK